MADPRDLTGLVGGTRPKKTIASYGLATGILDKRLDATPVQPISNLPVVSIARRIATVTGLLVDPGLMTLDVDPSRRFVILPVSSSGISVLRKFRSICSL